jgi:heptosyltransferase-2
MARAPSFLVADYREVKKQQYKRILLRGVNWLGDAVMLTPAIRALREAQPGAHIAILCKKGVADLYLNNTCIDEIIPYESDRGLRNILRLGRVIREKNFDLAIIFPRSFRSLLPVVLGKVPERVGYATAFRGILLTDKLPRSEEVLTTHRVNYYARLLRPLGIEKIPDRTEMHIDDESGKWADEFLASQRRWPGRKLVGMLCGATYGLAKQWLPERFAELARRLTESEIAEFLIVGGPGEIELARRVDREARVPLVNAAGKTSIMQLAALIRRCSVFVSNDTGPMHVADAVGAPIVAIFGPTDIVTTRPYGAGHRIITVNPECGPCLRRACPTDHFCMEDITVNDVEKVVRELLSDAGKVDEARMR